ncbi:glycosyltransferase family 2 protein [Mesoterricola sediminis]|uniref:Glycosyltransferase 2-like domain-containing protein n=1 Tax=Mesoterricola sediminis TaxID=2927980 RepID=A0AA48GLF5_9BACT|nr:glycosyltransferase family 2 protein [Mesoterricola sediminis]BDU75236.1 hypothetical protein METESE_01940 [Mesoterricola sediminis]
MTPRLSVVLPAYNRSRWMREAVESVLEPGLDCEVVVLDNGSSDDTWEILTQWAAREPRLRPMRWETNRAGEAYPALLEAARGEYVNFFADDDVMLPGGLARKMAILDAHPELGLVFTPVRQMDAAGADQGEGAWSVAAEADVLDGRDFFPPLVIANFIAMPCAMFRKAVAPPSGPLGDPAFSPFGDWQFWLEMARRTRFGFLREASARIRLHASQVTTTHGIGLGLYPETYLRVWRHWMLDAAPPFIPTSRAFEVMAGNLAGFLRACHGDDRDQVMAGLQRLLELQKEQARRLEREAGPGGVEAFWARIDDPDGLPRAAVRAYLRAFAPGDPVILVLSTRTEGGSQPIQDAVVEVARDLGLEAIPDVAIIDRDADLLELLRACAHVQQIPRGPASGDAFEGEAGERFAGAWMTASAEEGR